GSQSTHGRGHLEGRRPGPDQLRRAVGLGVGPDPDDSLPAELIPAAASLVFRTRDPGSDGAWISAGGQRRALFEDAQPSQDLAKIDGPPDPDALGRKQTVVLLILHALVPVFPIPTDWDSRPTLLRIVARRLFWMSHTGAPKTADRITLPVVGVIYDLVTRSPSIATGPLHATFVSRPTTKGTAPRCCHRNARCSIFRARFAISTPPPGVPCPLPRRTRGAPASRARGSLG